MDDRKIDGADEDENIVFKDNKTATKRFLEVRKKSQIWEYAEIKNQKETWYLSFAYEN